MDNLEEIKRKIKTVMVDHLTELGYPDISSEAIMHELKPMWIKIEEAGLIQPGMSFEAFCAHAQEQFLIAEINKMRSMP